MQGGLLRGFSEEVTLEMKWRGMRRENVLGRGQQVQRPGARKGLGGFKEEQGGAVRLECGQPWGARMETGQAGPHRLQSVGSQSRTGLSD